jgi:hypothetical protein
VAYDEQSGSGTHPEHEESIFILGVVCIVKAASMRVVEHGRRFFKIDPVFPPIGAGFVLIPHEAPPASMYSIHTVYAQ